MGKALIVIFSSHWGPGELFFQKEGRVLTISDMGIEQSLQEGAVGTMVDRHQSYFLICPVGQWDRGTK